MKATPPVRAFLVTLGVVITVVSGLAAPVMASTEDAAIFYDELSQYGTWEQDDKHGPVWFPNRVEEGWRPYLNGRWTPTEQGYTFETQEPWGWATYHYGNWMPTDSRGWVWVPGRTWYPNTVNWRTGDDYIGWAPIPPENFQPPSSYYGSGGYSPGMPLLELLTAPFYIFVKAASFLTGFGMPYSPNYSYLYSGSMAPPAYVPVIYRTTTVVTNYVYPNYYPPALMGRRSSAYCWGPPVNYVARVTHINHAVINNHIRRMKLNHLHHVMAPEQVIGRRPYVKNIIPPALRTGQPLPRIRPVENAHMAQAMLARPGLVPAVKGTPPLPGVIPRVKPVRHDADHGMVGTALPARAVHSLDADMQARIDRLPPKQRIVPAKPLMGAEPTRHPGAPAQALTPGARPVVPAARPTGPEEQAKTVPPRGEQPRRLPESGRRSAELEQRQQQEGPWRRIPEGQTARPMTSREQQHQQELRRQGRAESPPAQPQQPDQARRAQELQRQRSRDTERQRQIQAEQRARHQERQEQQIQGDQMRRRQEWQHQEQQRQEQRRRFQEDQQQRSQQLERQRQVHQQGQMQAEQVRRQQEVQRQEMQRRQQEMQQRQVQMQQQQQRRQQEMARQEQQRRFQEAQQRQMPPQMQRPSQAPPPLPTQAQPQQQQQQQQKKRKHQDQSQ